ncbi:DNA repair protein RadA [Thermanaeromonas sp. C210]|uniref:DNA repair protein RadA n=1 Tax=Thermanaeromonas sp. C210 TaxID=2731925 RepID=UPI00155B9A8B|nr:DNA repair protein RadA [Thermanaeromonas sp. C210]GFN23129.1 DNA repair protein RadA [Thermanaeromonas sp. C210]
MKTRVRFVCQACGYESASWLGRCPVCGAWDSLTREVEGAARLSSSHAGENTSPVLLADAPEIGAERLQSDVREWDRVLGGGLVPGSLILVGGAPGIGKSTLLLQLAHSLAERYGAVLYVSGEESPGQTRLRAQRLGALSRRIYLLAETNVQTILQQVEALEPVVVIVDSIQTVFLPDLPAAAGSLSQVRESAAAFLRAAKKGGPAAILVGHITKDGFLAGPKVLEHLVDCVLYLEGEGMQAYRLLRAAKNRFGSTNEVGVFAMTSQGLKEVPNPSETLLAERPHGVAGSVVTACLEGTRPLLLEIQALVSRTSFGHPRRLSTGLDYNRALLLMAVLEKRGHLPLGTHDVYLNVAGGINITEPAADLAVCLAIASSLQDKPLDPHLLVVGEVGLAGEVRAVAQAEKRVEEARRLGFTRFILPEGNKKTFPSRQEGEVYFVRTITEGLKLALGKTR